MINLQKKPFYNLCSIRRNIFKQTPLYSSKIFEKISFCHFCPKWLFVLEVDVLLASSRIVLNHNFMSSVHNQSIPICFRIELFESTVLTHVYSLPSCSKPFRNYVKPTIRFSVSGSFEIFGVTSKNTNCGGLNSRSKLSKIYSTVSEWILSHPVGLNFWVDNVRNFHWSMFIHQLMITLRKGWERRMLSRSLWCAFTDWFASVTILLYFTLLPSYRGVDTILSEMCPTIAPTLWTSDLPKWDKQMISWHLFYFCLRQFFSLRIAV